MDLKDKIIDGQAIAAEIRKELRKEVEEMISSGNMPPCVAVVLVGDRKDSATYVRMKVKACEETGVKSILKKLPSTISEAELLAIIHELNMDNSVHGILVQMPLPDGIESTKILMAIDLSKDVDGFHPMHVGNLALKSRKPEFVACTPLGCMELLKRSNISV